MTNLTGAGYLELMQQLDVLLFFANQKPGAIINRNVNIDYVAKKVVEAGLFYRDSWFVQGHDPQILGLEKAVKNLDNSDDHSLGKFCGIPETAIAGWRDGKITPKQQVEIAQENEAYRALGFHSFIPSRSNFNREISEYHLPKSDFLRKNLPQLYQRLLVLGEENFARFI